MAKVKCLLVSCYARDGSPEARLQVHETLKHWIQTTDPAQWKLVDVETDSEAFLGTNLYGLISE